MPNNEKTITNNIIYSGCKVELPNDLYYLHKKSENEVIFANGKGKIIYYEREMCDLLKEFDLGSSFIINITILK